MTWLIAVCCVLCAGLGCEGFQRKFTRKPKGRTPPPSPIISFLDYSGAMTPLDRYRKHYLIFDYWNDELMDGLRAKPPNAKLFKRTSSEALTELTALRELLTDEAAVRMDGVIEARAKLDRQLQVGTLREFQAARILRALEAQTRQIDREFFWRDVADVLDRTPEDLQKEAEWQAVVERRAKDKDAAAEGKEPMSAFHTSGPLSIVPESDEEE